MPWHTPPDRSNSGASVRPPDCANIVPSGDAFILTGLDVAHAGGFTGDAALANFAFDKVGAAGNQSQASRLRSSALRPPTVTHAPYAPIATP